MHKEDRFKQHTRSVWRRGYEACESWPAEWRAALAPAIDALVAELRLCYVAATRAVDRLYLTYASRRPGHGRALSATPSRFLRGIPAELVERRVA